jgi:hypothetical protein
VNAAGLGPTWAHTTQPGQQSSSWGIEAVVDLFVWRNKRVGCFLEPSHGIAPGNENRKSMGLTGGLFSPFARLLRAPRTTSSKDFPPAA